MNKVVEEESVVGEGKVVDEKVVEENPLVTSNNINSQEEELRKQIEPYRVDFNDPNSIMYYGKEIVDELAEVLSTISANHSQTTVGNIAEYNEITDKIGNFPQVLQKEVEKGSQLPAKTQRKVFRFINNLFKTDLKVVEASFHELLEKHLANLDNVQKIFEGSLNELKRDTTMSNEFIHAMDPYLKLIEMLIKVGYEDLEEYRAKVEIWKKSTRNETAIQLENIKISKFEKKLFTLQKSLTGYQEKQCQLQIGLYNKFELANNCVEVLSDTLPFLRTDAVTQVDRTVDDLKLQMQMQLANKVNDTLRESAKLTMETTKKITQLSKEGIMKTDTYAEVGKTLLDTLKLINKAMTDDRNNEKEIVKLQKVMEPLQTEIDKFSTLFPTLQDEDTMTTETPKVLINTPKNKNGHH